MTRDEIMKMEAGRELDALVAEYVMGWYWIQIEGEQGMRLIGEDVVVQGMKMVRSYNPTYDKNIPKVGGAILPSYSEDIRDAWQVVEKLQAEYHWVIKSPFGIGDPWVAGLTPLGCTGWNGRPDFDAIAPTAPLAICRAALLTCAGC